MADKKKMNQEEVTEEVLNWKNEAFIEVLEEFEKGNDIEAKRFVEFFAKYETRDVKNKPVEEVEHELREQIKLKFNLDDYETMTMNQCMQHILEEIESDTEDELLDAFKVFDLEDTGMIKLSTLKMIMEDYGPLGYTLNEEQVIRMLGMFQIDYENVDISKNREVAESKSKSKSQSQSTTVEVVDETTGETTVVTQPKVKVEEKVEYVEIPEMVKGQRHIRYVKDVDVDYRIFGKKIIEMISHQEGTLKSHWGGQD